ncbi:MAG: methylmalonyl Co-A mutase-associated GTPase MeaB [Archaeoglobaceae archaeon]|nr:methylmalonyl Co-A mutase-associated GTPase MeaB [Archaeoglobaceae archaeon]MDW7989059.1 methylmalonyl Co-A mutase-associated GTPase MeaB [Archaeoglobaceae archaeon]
MNVEEIVEGVTKGNRKLLAKAISYVENEHPNSKEILRRLYPRTGNAHVVGITGFPGVGKSTIVSKLTEEFRRRGKSVGIVAVDPSSPFTGGALLGDRLRLEGADVSKNLWLDEKVFFRSMGSRGRLGGIAKKTGDVVKLLDSAKYEIILVETVGAGQSEVGVLEVADTVVVILMPETGDDIQVNKAGILEIGDIFVINKADLGGAENVERWIKYMLSLDEETVMELSKLSHAEESRLMERLRWKKPVLKTIADRGVGIKELANEIEKHYEVLKKNGVLQKKRNERAKISAIEIAIEEIRAEIVRRYKSLLDGEIDPYTVADKIVKEVLRC